MVPIMVLNTHIFLKKLLPTFLPTYLRMHVCRWPHVALCRCVFFRLAVLTGEAPMPLFWIVGKLKLGSKKYVNINMRIHSYLVLSAPSAFDYITWLFHTKSITWLFPTNSHSLSSHARLWPRLFLRFACEQVRRLLSGR